MNLEEAHSILLQGYEIMNENIRPSMQAGILMAVISVASLFVGVGISWGLQTGKENAIIQTQQRHDRDISKLNGQYETISVQLATQQQLLLDIKSKLESGQ